MRAPSTADHRHLPSIGNLVDSLVSSDFKPNWPPDVFGVVGTILSESGAYTRVLDGWPPKSLLTRGVPPGPERVRIWAEWVVQKGAEWRSAAAAAKDAPKEVRTRWEKILSFRDQPVTAARTKRALADALLELSALADQASERAGIPLSTDMESFDQFWLEACVDCLMLNHTLCRDILPSRLRVLPKLHTPRSGLTFRSMTHHLALCPTGDVSPRWNQVVTNIPVTRLNVLVVPYPFDVRPKQFLPNCCDLQEVDGRFGFFAFNPARGSEVEEAVAGLHRKATNLVGKIDMIVLPEGAVTNSQYELIRKRASLRDLPVLIAGVIDGPDKAGCCRKNLCRMQIRDPIANRRVVQGKHHRWHLSRSQLIQYGLGSILDPQRHWWEHIEILPRSVQFVSLNERMTVCVLLCEDLARQDPVAGILRAVGPNLVVALLMDGPQLRSRWSAKYATVLADDPGCSVLSVTSLGMAELCRPHAVPPSRVVGLWKDARSGEPVELTLPKDAHGLVLTLAVEEDKEWTADGRSDSSVSAYPILAGLHPIFL